MRKQVNKCICGTLRSQEVLLGWGPPTQWQPLGYEHSHHAQGYHSFLATFVPAFMVSFLLQVSASDDDGPVNNVITYSLVGGNQLGHFAIDPKKGKLQVAKALDWEQVRVMSRLSRSVAL